MGTLGGNRDDESPTSYPRVLGRSTGQQRWNGLVLGTSSGGHIGSADRIVLTVNCAMIESGWTEVSLRRLFTFNILEIL